MLFATPDFGAAGAALLCLMVLGATILVVALSGIAWGIRLYRNNSPNISRRGLFVIVLSGLIPICCWVLPPHLIWLEYGTYPVGRYPKEIKHGARKDEVIATLGRPHQLIKRKDSEEWIYWCDSFGIEFFGVFFGPDDRVMGTHGY